MDPTNAPAGVGAGAAWRVIAASVVGSGHVRAGVPCQDAHAYRILPDGTLLIAVADGAGSAARAAEGAAAAVRHAVAAMAEVLGVPTAARIADRVGGPALADDPWGPAGDGDGGDGDFPYRSAVSAGFRAARAALEDLAITAWEPLRAYACTLTCAVAGSGRLAVGQIGDGVAIARRLDGDLFAASRPQKGEYANEAHFLTRPDALEIVAYGVAPGPVDAVGLTTDGLLRLALRWPELVPHAPFWAPLLAFAARVDDAAGASDQLAAFLGSPRVAARTDDDKTLVLAVRRTAAAGGSP